MVQVFGPHPCVRPGGSSWLPPGLALAIVVIWRVNQWLESLFLCICICISLSLCISLSNKHIFKEREIKLLKRHSGPPMFCHHLLPSLQNITENMKRVLWESRLRKAKDTDFPNTLPTMGPPCTRGLGLGILKPLLKKTPRVKDGPLNSHLLGHPNLTHGQSLLRRWPWVPGAEPIVGKGSQGPGQSSRGKQDQWEGGGGRRGLST